MAESLNKEKLLKESPYFCMIPWTHLHSWPNGDVYPCCVSDSFKPISHLNDQTSLKDAWNSPRLKEIRNNMLNDKASVECRRCYELENAGSHTQRTDQNALFAHHWDVVESTHPDGHVDNMNIVYMDFRFSNLCNLKCRSCGPDLSSSWSEDGLALGISRNSSKIIRPFSDPSRFWNQLEEVLPKVETIYFAGGEPLLMDEHYQILNRLIELKRSQDVKISYNSNFSFLKYKDHSVLDLWKQFSKVTVGASLDAREKRAEYIRKGTLWTRVIENRELMKKEVPHASFYINFTLSVFNVFEAPSFHRDWFELGYIGIGDWNFNPVTFPHHYTTSVLPNHLRQQAIQLYQKHLEWVIQRAGPSHLIVNRWKMALQWLEDSTHQDKVQDFKKITLKLDQLRGESFEKVFPELKELIL